MPRTAARLLVDCLVEQGCDRADTLIRIRGVGRTAGCLEVHPQRALLADREAVLCGLAIDQETAAWAQVRSGSSPIRAILFTHDEQQRTLAEASKKTLSSNKPFREPIVTEIVNATQFYPAEEYHQDYHTKNPVRYKFYRANCGRDARLKQLWGSQAQQ
jgi:hypothetical protein